jgi:predicted solute-binding protein
MDRFPEAFKRFEEVVDTSKIKSFRQLKLAFATWAGRKWKESPLQLQALRVQAERLRLVGAIEVSREEWERERVEIDRLYRRVYYCRLRYVYNEAVFKALTLERFRARGKRRVELEKRISEAQERMEFWRKQWDEAYGRLKRERERFKLKSIKRG